MAKPNFARLPKRPKGPPVREALSLEKLKETPFRRPQPGDVVTVFIKTPKGYRTTTRVVAEDKVAVKPELAPGETIVHHSFNPVTEKMMRTRLGIGPKD